MTSSVDSEFYYPKIPSQHDLQNKFRIHSSKEVDASYCFRMRHSRAFNSVYRRN